MIVISCSFLMFVGIEINSLLVNTTGIWHQKAGQTFLHIQSTPSMSFTYFDINDQQFLTIFFGRKLVLEKQFVFFLIT